MDAYWALVFDNFEGQDEIYYFSSYEIAKQNFDAIVNTYEHDLEVSEFNVYDNSCSWFDSTYNEYSTYVTLAKQVFPKVYDELIF